MNISLKKKAESELPGLVIVGPTSPPITGIEVMTLVLLDELKKNSCFKVFHLDSGDHRQNGARGRLDFKNIYLGIYHPIALAILIAKTKSRMVYLPISQCWLGFIRDALMIWLSVMLKTKVIIHLHGGCFDRFYKDANGPARFIIGRTLMKVDHAIVLSPRFKKIFGSIIPEEKVSVVANGIPDYKRTRKRECPSKPVTILYMSSLRPQKGYRDALEAVSIAASKCDCHVLFAGEWKSKAEAEWAHRRVDELGIGHRVEFIGVIEGQKKTDLLCDADIFIFTPNYPEGQPLVVLEAMACGLPIIATDVGAIGDCIKDNESGFLVRPGDVKAIADRIIVLANDHALREKVAVAAYDSFSNEFTSSIFGDRMRTTLEAVLTGVPE